jgi:signal transduction histidine kinase
MKRALVILGILFPPIWLIVLYLLPDLDEVFAVPIFHFYVVTFFTFTSATVAMLIGFTLGQESLSHHRLLVTAFASMAAIFFVHGLTTRGAIILESNPGIRWAAWLTLFIGGLLFALATFDRPTRPLNPAFYRVINWSLAIFCVLFAGIVFITPEWLTAIDEVASPFHNQLAFWATLIVWIYALVRFGQIWRETGDRLDGIIALIALWLLWATVSMHQFPVWQLSWWMYHMLLLASVLTAFVALLSQYEQLRYFRPTWYYFAIGIVVTALMTLLASFILSEAVEQEFMTTANPEEAVVQARVLGLGVAGLSLSALFLALLIVVRRAEKLIADRTKELSTAYANLQASEALRDDLTDMIIHDLRSPLTGINLSIDMLAESIDDPRKAAFRDRFLSNARSSVQRMLSLINQLLDMARFEAGQLELNCKPIQVGELIQVRAAAYAVQSEANNIELVVEPLDGLPDVSADAGFIGRVLDNLIDNALKYTDSGGKVSLLARANGSDVVIQVRDTGEGIPPQSLEQIFDKFTQVKSKEDREARQGTGLGLPFCKLVIEAHNGRIWAESEMGTGSLFSFTLPIA